MLQAAVESTPSPLSEAPARGDNTDRTGVVPN
jgi:hypothetical protein